MLMMDPDGFRSLAVLRDQLEWLRSEHPEKTSLIACVEGHLDTIRRAGSVESFTVKAGRFDPSRFLSGPAHPTPATAAG